MASSGKQVTGARARIISGQVGRGQKGEKKAQKGFKEMRMKHISYGATLVPDS